MTQPIPILAVCGFLGSGKTTLLRRWRLEPTFRDAAVLVHDYSDFGLDAELLAGEDATPVPGRLAGRVAALHGSHAREQLRTSVAAALEGVASLSPPAPCVLCESTGAARPWPLIEALTQDDRFHLRHFIVTVDALNLHRDFSDGRALTGEVEPPRDPALRQAAEVLAEQLLFASVIVLTKIDTVPKPILDAQVRVLQRLRPNVPVGLSALGGLLPSQLDPTAAPDRGEQQALAERFGLTNRAPTPEGMTSVVFREVRPFHPERLHRACHTSLGTGLYRTKGFLWLASRPAVVLLWQQSGSQVGLEVRGVWRVAVLDDTEGALLPEEREMARQLASTHPMFGDRRNELTLIGEPAAVRAFSDALHDALCTDEEVDAWSDGATFDDPWPTNAGGPSRRCKVNWRGRTPSAASLPPPP